MTLLARREARSASRRNRQRANERLGMPFQKSSAIAVEAVWGISPPPQQFGRSIRGAARVRRGSDGAAAPATAAVLERAIAESWLDWDGRLDFSAGLEAYSHLERELRGFERVSLS